HNNRNETHTLLTALAQAHTHTTPLTWTTTLNHTPTTHTNLPTYPFQHHRYWLDTPTTPGDAAALGLATTTHPLLGAAVNLADTDGYLFTSRLSLASHPWLADHAVMGSVLLPGTAFVELALHAGAQADSPHVEELTLEAPLVIPAEGSVQVQVTVGEPDGDGRRPVAVHSRIPGDLADALHSADGWTRHATGAVCPEPEAAGEPGSLVQWPPAGATEVGVDGLYERLHGIGFGYGPAFQGLRAVWRSADVLYAEVALPGGLQENGEAFALHPALLDAVLHVLGLRSGEELGAAQLPFSWNGVSLHATGATVLRACLAPRGSDSYTLTIADSSGAPVATIDALMTRPITAEQIARARSVPNSPLFQVEWRTVTASAGSSGETVPGAAGQGRWAVVGDDPLGMSAGLKSTGASLDVYPDIEAFAAAMEAGSAVPEYVFAPFASDPARAVDDIPAAALSGTRRALALLQFWLGDERYAASRLVLLTHHA
ncbi:polyketide synthase dehydratase domain-containing protein, partial [Kitasatospora aburaviensis]|uniref:polyketide synthase dehydratase domain-containing protein n=1 Tax=Kitasatospora aburaviensis TaxID=67265 RepID=UPI0031EA26E7